MGKIFLEGRLKTDCWPYHPGRAIKESRGLKGDNMNKIDAKWMADAARYFKEEVLDIMPGIPREELSAMVGEYIYYQQTDISKSEAHKVVEETCVKK